MLPAAAVGGEVVTRRLAAAGVAKPGSLAWLFDGVQARGWERALEGLIRDGTAEMIRIEGVRGEWVADAAALEAPFRGRTVALSPFDRLIHDRTRTESLWDFEYRLEIYVPKAKRRWGYFVLPVLRGDRLVGRFDPRFDRETRVLHVGSVHAEDGWRAGDAEAVRRSIEELARWLGAVDVTVENVPAGWRRALQG
ncbi:MAG: crosslink repair DNA glycosylase YcaQ family protein [Actinomycetota bacterium]